MGWNLYHGSGIMYPEQAEQENPRKGRSKRPAGVGVVLGSLLLTAMLCTYHVNEMGWSFLNPTGAAAASEVPCTNVLGVIGMYLAGLIYALLGAAALYAAVLLMIIGIAMIMYPFQRRVGQWVSLIVMIISACAVLSIQPWILTEWATENCICTPGGKLGYLDGVCLVEAFAGRYYGITLLLLIHALAVIYFARLTPQDVCRATQKDLIAMYRRWREKRRLKKEAEHAEDMRWKEHGREMARQEADARMRDSIQTPLPLRQAQPARVEQQPQTSVQPTLPPRIRSSVTVGSARQEPEEERYPEVPVEREPVREVPRRAPRSEQPRRIMPPRPQNRENILDLMRPIEEAMANNGTVHVEGPETDDDDPRRNEWLERAMEEHARARLNGRQTQDEPERQRGMDKPVRAPRPVPAPKPVRTLPQEDNREQYADYPLPPYDLLEYRPEPPEVGEAAQEEMLDMQGRIIDTLETFKITVAPGDITRGPSITRYEFYPPRGKSVKRICNLCNDLMLATESKSVNILAPIPGKNTVGVELENATKSPVYLRELLQSEAFRNPALRIPVALGKDVYGNAVIGDLAAMPHTLVAGTTGSGKSVCINSMILSMLYKFRPDELRLVLVDPKVVEMQPYRKLPHLACPVVTNPARVIGALRWAVNEMEHRYKLFSQIGVRNFEDFNNRPPDFEPEPDEDEYQDDDAPVDYDAVEAIASEIERQAEDEVPLGEEEQDEFDFEEEERIPSRLPYIVIIIDELADLMMVVKEDLENYIARLTQKARAAGIHLVVATQTPRSNVVTGIIKANIPSRIALKVSSPLDSRIILDTAGAENLLGKGDFLFLPPGGITKLTRAQGAYVSDAEIASIIKFCAAHAKQNFDQSVTAEMNNSEGASSGGGDDGGRIGGKGMSDEDAELYTRCVNLVVTERKASTSLLQRRFSIGYSRAAKIMDIMEERGVISPPQGATRAREVLIDAP